MIPVIEDFPTGLNGVEIASHITRKKTVPFLDIVKEKQIIITADTIVWHENKFMGKPKNVSEAKDMLKDYLLMHTRLLQLWAFCKNRN